MEWIKCSERLPTEADANEQGKVIGADRRLDGNGDWYAEDTYWNTVEELGWLYWMPFPMPEPPHAT
jgi:hypothetical protein